MTASDAASALTWSCPRCHHEQVLVPWNEAWLNQFPRQCQARCQECYAVWPVVLCVFRVGDLEDDDA